MRKGISGDQGASHVKLLYFELVAGEWESPWSDESLIIIVKADAISRESHWQIVSEDQLNGIYIEESFCFFPHVLAVGAGLEPAGAPGGFGGARALLHQPTAPQRPLAAHHALGCLLEFRHARRFASTCQNLSEFLSTSSRALARSST